MVEGATVRVLAAHVGQAAHIHTLVPHTGPLTGAVPIAHTLQGHTPHIGVATGAGGTGAHGSMVGWTTEGICSTGSRHITGVLTLAVVAGSSAGTIIVGEALVRGATASKLVRNSARGTLALVGSDGVDTDGCGLTRTVLTLVNVHTPVVGKDVSWLTLTRGHVVGGAARASATVDLAARIHTPVIDDLAHLVTGAVTIGLALHLGAAQGGVGVTNVLGGTLTLRSIVDHPTLTVGATPRSVTGVDTLPVT